jgi:hypothetical protein
MMLLLLYIIYVKIKNKKRLILDTTYCYEKCLIGKAASEVYLAVDSSVVDAAVDFDSFTENCFKTCPYKDVHEKSCNQRGLV